MLDGMGKRPADNAETYVVALIGVTAGSELDGLDLWPNIKVCLCDDLGCKDKIFTREVLAAEIIALASRYGSDAEKLCREVLKLVRARMPSMASMQPETTRLTNSLEV